MRSTKQRAKIIVARYNQLTKQQNEQPKQPKRKLNLKAIISITMASVFVITGITLGLVFGINKNNNRLNLDQMYITNFDNYVALGAGAMTNSYFDESTYNRQIVGVSDEGDIESVKFGKHQDSRDDRYYDQNNMTITGFSSNERYSFVGIINRI